MLVPTRFRQLITCNVLSDQSIKRNIVVKGADQVIAVPPGVSALKIPFMTMGFRKSDHVHPMSCPAFTKMRRVKESVNLSLEFFFRVMSIGN